MLLDQLPTFIDLPLSPIRSKQFPLPILIIVLPQPDIVAPIGVGLLSPPMAHIPDPLALVDVPVAVIVYAIAFFIVVLEISFVTLSVWVLVFALPVPGVVQVQAFVPVTLHVYCSAVACCSSFFPLAFVCPVAFRVVKPLAMEQTIFHLSEVIVTIRVIDSNIVTDHSAFEIIALWVIKLNYLLLIFFLYELLYFILALFDVFLETLTLIAFPLLFFLFVQNKLVF